MTDNSDDISIKNAIVKFPDGYYLEYGDMMLHGNKLTVLLGENGSGKSTLLRIIQDIIPLASGEIFIGEKSYTAKGIQDEIISFYSKEQLFNFLTPVEYFSLVAANYHIPAKKLKDAMSNLQSYFSKSWDSEKKVIKSYSDGNQQLIGIAAALIVCPKIILLDEPFNFLDNDTKRKLGAYLQKLVSEKGTTIIMTSNADVSDYVLTFDSCKISTKVSHA